MKINAKMMQDKNLLTYIEKYVIMMGKGDDKMPRERTRKKAKVNYDYINQFANAHYDRLTILLPRGTKKKLAALAKAHEMTLSSFICQFIPEDVMEGLI